MLFSQPPDLLMFRSSPMIFSSALPTYGLGPQSFSPFSDHHHPSSSLSRMQNPVAASSCSPTSSPSTSRSLTTVKGERCVGCGSDSTIRVHYGAPSCHGCKAFFRRSVFEGRVYMCSADNLCSITNESRNRCRACRLRNCLEGGMNPKHVREERTKVEKMASVLTNGVSATMEFTSSDHEHIQEATSISPSGSLPNGGSSNGAVEDCQLSQFLYALEQETELLVEEERGENQDRNEWSRHVSLTLGIQNPQLVIHRTPLNWKCERVVTSNDLFSQWYRAFVLHADYALGIPDFRIIPLNDQTQLFKQNFMAFGWITYSYKCYENNLEDIGMPMGNGSYIPYQQEDQRLMESKWVNVYGGVCQKLIDLTVKPMKELQMTKEEYCLLKAITLFQQDCPLSLSALTICKRVTDRLLEALAKSIARNQPHLSNIQQSSRAMKLLLLIPCFNHIGNFEACMIQTLSACDKSELSGVPMELMESHGGNLPSHQ